VSDDERGGAPISIPTAAKGRVRPFEPIDLVVVNDAVIRIAAIEGEFPWHHHDEDELFLSRSGGPSSCCSNDPRPASTGTEG